MIRNLREIKNDTLHTPDGDVGRIIDFYFDDSQWVIQYFVVDTGHVLPGHRVLLTPKAFSQCDWGKHRVHVNLSKEKVKNSLDIKSVKTFSQQKEQEFHKRYGWPIPWAGSSLFQTGMLGSVTAESYALSEAEKGLASSEESSPDLHLMSFNDVHHYQVEATDGKLGHIEDLMVDDQSWSIRYMILSTRNWLPSNKVIVMPSHVKDIRWSKSPRFTSKTPH